MKRWLVCVFVILIVVFAPLTTADARYLRKSSVGSWRKTIKKDGLYYTLYCEYDKKGRVTHAGSSVSKKYKLSGAKNNYRTVVGSLVHKVKIKGKVKKVKFSTGYVGKLRDLEYVDLNKVSSKAAIWLSQGQVFRHHGYLYYKTDPAAGEDAFYEYIEPYRTGAKPKTKIFGKSVSSPYLLKAIRVGKLTEDTKKHLSKNAQKVATAAVAFKKSAFAKQAALTPGMNEAQKVLALEKELQATVTFTNIDASYHSQKGYATLVNKKAQEKDIAETMKLLLDSENIPCGVRDDETGFENNWHSPAWLIVKLYGKWYNFYPTSKQGFLITDKAIAELGKLRKFAAPSCTSYFEDDHPAFFLSETNKSYYVRSNADCEAIFAKQCAEQAGQETLVLKQIYPAHKNLPLSYKPEYASIEKLCLLVEKLTGRNVVRSNTSYNSTDLNPYYCSATYTLHLY